MARKASLNHILAPALAVTVLLLSTAPVWPVHAGGGVVLRPPFNGTYRVTAYFDHDEPSYDAGDDGYIWIYNGERVASSYANKTGEPYPYDGHDGWDWSMTIGTDVLAAATGTVVFSTDNWVEHPCYGRTIIIDHGNGYYTQYSHLSQRLVNVGNPVTVGQHIAESGNTSDPSDPNHCPVGAHLHFGVRHGGWDNTTYAVDPFGWRGSGRDPLYNFNQKESTCLWAGAPGDVISCGDVIIEDDELGDQAAGWEQYPSWDDGCAASTTSWARCNQGNGFRYHWTNVWDPASWWVNWRPWYSSYGQIRYPGYYQIHAFVPAGGDSTKTKTSNARYEVVHGYYCNQTTIVPVNQTV
jgi:murein DD-endopeptidase MepM/ murein hydrolase activator NlpD